MNDQKSFPELVESLLVMEYGKTEEEAKSLVSKHTGIVTKAIMNGLSFKNVRVCAMAIDIAESGG